VKKTGALGGGGGGRVSSKFIAVMNETDALRRLDGIDQSANTHATRKKKKVICMYIHINKKKEVMKEREKNTVIIMDILVNSFLTTLYQLQRMRSVE
jgi:C4-type Zn-finger protein